MTKVTKTLPTSNDHAEIVRVVNQIWQAIGANTSNVKDVTNTGVTGGLAFGTPPIVSNGGNNGGGNGGGGGFENPMKQRGDMIYGEAAGKPTRLPVGEEGQVLVLTDGFPQWITVDMTGWGS